jgi:hypothetical protein
MLEGKTCSLRRAFTTFLTNVSSSRKRSNKVLEPERPCPHLQSTPRPGLLQDQEYLESNPASRDAQTEATCS